jgi:hypothetical protein
MQKHSGYLLVSVLLSLSACKGHEKKILIYGSSDIKVDDAKQHVTVSEGTTHHEQELDFSSGSPVTLDVQSPQGKLSVSAVDDGLYILNLKMDTVIGSYQHVGANAKNNVSQDEAKHDLDSLQKLVLGQNVSEANRNYFIAPGKIVKVTAETNAKVFGPFTSIPGSFDAGSAPEIYKFYTLPEVREIIERLEKATK